MKYLKSALDFLVGNDVIEFEKAGKLFAQVDKSRRHQFWKIWTVRQYFWRICLRGTWGHKSLYVWDIFSFTQALYWVAIMKLKIDHLPSRSSLLGSDKGFLPYLSGIKRHRTWSQIIWSYIGSPRARRRWVVFPSSSGFPICYVIIVRVYCVLFWCRYRYEYYWPAEKDHGEIDV